MHDPAHPAADRARALLEHTGHGSLPRSGGPTGYWNTAAHSAFEDTTLAQLFKDAPPPSPATHLVYQTEPPAGSEDDLPQRRAGFTYVDYTAPGTFPSRSPACPGGAAVPSRPCITPRSTSRSRPR
ncbi:hypothetical protein ACFV2A_26510 [Streptomyces californicus]|uniref:hypothetical protein n=1 Tax=Streptomyces californicus TaxID=67351 RepID=UPI0036BDF8A6